MRVGLYVSHQFRKIPLIFSFTNYKFSPLYFFNYALSKKWWKVLTRVAENPDKCDRSARNEAPGFKQREIICFKTSFFGVRTALGIYNKVLAFLWICERSY
jgi:hypothetical protein